MGVRLKLGSHALTSSIMGLSPLSYSFVFTTPTRESNDKVIFASWKRVHIVSPSLVLQSCGVRRIVVVPL